MNLSLLATTLMATGAQGPVRTETARTETVRSQPSWVLENANVRLAITQTGAQMAPVDFARNAERPIQPYYISPWQDEGLSLKPPVLTSLRGDFFALPFGGNAGAYEGMRFVPHGEPAGSKWSFVDAKRKGRVTSLTLALNTGAPKGRVTKTVRLVDGQNAVYSQERLDGYDLRSSLGHHAILAVPERPGSLRVATSPFQYGMTSPFLFSDPKNREYQSFEIGKRFASLKRVPLAWKGSPPTDASAFPARFGFADLLAVFSRKAPELPQGIAWTTATNDDAGYVWFSLRDPRVLPTTVIWIENHGRHGSPWNGRNRCLGLEDVCSYLNEGMPISARPNDVSAAGIPTSLRLRPDRPTFVNYVQGVARVPRGFREVRTLEFGRGKVTFVSVTGKRVSVPLDYGFVRLGVVRA